VLNLQVEKVQILAEHKRVVEELRKKDMLIQELREELESMYVPVAPSFLALH
jgi:hypothetical protein